MTIYADTSFFPWLYVKDPHSTKADQMLGAGVRPPLTPLHIAEWQHAIAQQVFRRHMTIAEAHLLHRSREPGDVGPQLLDHGPLDTTLTDT